MELWNDGLDMEILSHISCFDATQRQKDYQPTIQTAPDIGDMEFRKTPEFGLFVSVGRRRCSPTDIFRNSSLQIILNRTENKPRTRKWKATANRLGSWKDFHHEVIATTCQSLPLTAYK